MQLKEKQKRGSFMQLELLNQQGQITQKIDVSDKLFASKYNESLVHQIIVAFKANARSGTRAQLDRAMVKHSTRKPWRQKGTGRARAGMCSSPLWRGGGRTFPNSSSEKFSQKVNKKMYRLSIITILSQLIRENRLVVTDGIKIDKPKSQLLISALKQFNSESILFIVKEIDNRLRLASRNLKNILIIECKNIDPVVLISYDKILISTDAIRQLEGSLS
jgi:large subunit ribosomal protein L4